jgi:iron complex transport system substrate-binding protein
MWREPGSPESPTRRAYLRYGGAIVGGGLLAGCTGDTGAESDPTDALADTGIEGLSTTDRGQIDYETLLEVDPDSILVRGHEDKSREEFVDTVLAFMKDHGTASELTAVQNDTVFRGGPICSGPLHHLFLTERYATLYFPEVYSGELFDRDRVAGIVSGDRT